MNVYLFVFWFEPGPNPLQVVAEVSIFALLCQINLPVDYLEVESIRFLLLALENLECFGLFVNLILADSDQNQDLFVLFMMDDFEIVTWIFEVNISLEICLYLILVSFLECHDEVPPFNQLCLLAWECLFDPVFIAMPQTFFLFRHLHVLYRSITISFKKRY